MRASQIRNKKDRYLYRFLEILPGLLSWLTLFFCVFFSFTKPVWVAVFIICFDIYWLLKVSYLSIFLIDSYRQLKHNMEINWLKRCQNLPNWQDIYHLVILPTSKEGLDVINPTFEALLKTNYPKDKMIIVFATEEKYKDKGRRNARIVRRRYGNKFFKFLVTEHPQDIVGEIAGKGSNETWAARQAQKLIDKLGIPYENVIASVFDIDTCVHPDYFACLTYKFLTVKNPHQASYQPVPMFFNNFWEASLVSRLMGLNTTFWNMMEQGRPERLYTFSSHSMSFKTLVAIGFWETDVVSEDSRIFWQNFLHYKGNYRSIPLLLPVYMDSVTAKNLWRALVNQYKQQRRWSWGVENVPYVLFKFLKDRQIPFKTKLIHSFRLVEGFHSWATNALIIFIFGWFPLIVGGKEFTETLLAQNLPFLTQLLMTLAMIGMIVSASLGFLLVNINLKKRYGWRKFVSLLVQWIFLPVSTIVFGSIPALDSQTRLMFGRYMGFWITEKMRKKEMSIEEASSFIK